MDASHGDRLKPVHVHAIEVLVDGDMNHPVVRGRSVPVLFARRDPHRVAGPKLAHRTTPGLGASHACDHVQRLAERVGVPGRASARFEGHAHDFDPGRVRRLEQRILPDRAGEPIAAGANRCGIRRRL